MAGTVGAAGVTIGEYRVVDVLGSGSYATVYSAVHTVTGNLVAIKAIPLARLTQHSRKALEAEIRLHSSLRHPSVVRLMDVRRSPKYIFLVLRHCEGGDV